MAKTHCLEHKSMGEFPPPNDEDSGECSSSTLANSLVVCFFVFFTVPFSLTSYPEILFSSSITSTHIAPSSEIFLYCVVPLVGPALDVVWRKNSEPVLQDIPHIRLRKLTTTYITTAVLIIGNFRPSDDGTYQCMATNDTERITGRIANLTGKSAQLLHCWGKQNCIGQANFTNA